MDVLLPFLVRASGVVPEHFGGLHPYERILVLLIAFGPFVVLAGVVAVVRRRDVAAEQAEQEQADRADDGAGAARGATPGPPAS